FFAGGLVLALVGHVAAVRQVVIAGIEFIHVDVHSAGIHRNLRAVDLHLLGSGHRLLDAGIGSQFLQGDALFVALFRLLFRLAVIPLVFGFLIFRLFGFRFLGFCLGRGGFRFFLGTAGQVGVQAVLGVFAGQVFQQEIQFLLPERAAGFVSFTGNRRNGL